MLNLIQAKNITEEVLNRRKRSKEIKSPNKYNNIATSNIYYFKGKEESDKYKIHNSVEKSFNNSMTMKYGPQKEDSNKTIIKLDNQIKSTYYQNRQPHDYNSNQKNYKIIPLYQKKTTTRYNNTTFTYPINYDLKKKLTDKKHEIIPNKKGELIKSEYGKTNYKPKGAKAYNIFDLNIAVPQKNVKSEKSNFSYISQNSSSSERLLARKIDSLIEKIGNYMEDVKKRDDDYKKRDDDYKKRMDEFLKKIDERDKLNSARDEFYKKKLDDVMKLLLAEKKK